MGQCCGMETRVTMRELQVSAHGRNSNLETNKIRAKNYEIDDKVDDNPFSED